MATKGSPSHFFSPSTMEVGSFSSFEPQDQDAQILYSHLGDSTFVEYFNSFLLLPAFSNRLYYNKDTGHFEQVHSHGMVYWDGKATPSSSFSTLYLPEEAVGAPLDKEQSWQWVVQHRFPLFLRSDLYSEYKISKLLTLSGQETGAPHTRKQGRRFTEISTAYGDLETNADTQGSSFNLPNINDSRSASKSSVSSIELDLLKSPRVVLSKSDALLEAKSSRRLERKVRWHRSLSVNPDALPNYPLGSQASSSFYRSSTTSLLSVGGRTEQYLSTKSGMNALWKFLKGKAGEKNLLFWLDAERIKYYNNDADRQRLLKELRERYFHSGSALELPAETIMKLKLSKSGDFGMEQIADLQDAMIAKLKEYWCPQFLLHCCQDQDTSSTSRSSSSPSLKVSGVFRSCSTAPAALHSLADTRQTGYSRVVTPLTPTQTPTYKKLLRPRPKSTSSTDQRSSENSVRRNEFSPSTSNMETETVTEVQTSRFLTIHPFDDDETNDSPLKRKKWTRKVWEKSGASETLVVDGGLQANQPIPAPAEKYSQLAKYSTHHFPDPESRCASRMDGSEHGLCKSQCRVLSISGTPVHADPLYLHMGDGPKPAYEPLLSCLTMENRKAGGYFLHYLDKLEDAAYVNCLLFWREVQEYKTLFIQDTFSPCAVEMKAKSVFGRYISECCNESIQCPAPIASTMSTSLWPAYEDLFDEAEEHALDMLLTQWNDLCNSEDLAFQKLDTIQLFSESSHDLSTVYSETEYDDLDTPFTGYYAQGSTSYVSGAGSSSGSSKSSGAISLDMILNNSIEMEHFKMFLNKHCAAEDLMCWMDIESFRGVPLTDKYIRNVRAKQLKKQYFNKDYFFGPHSPASKEAQRQTKAAGGINLGARMPSRPRTPLFREAQKHIRARLEKRWLIQFINSPGFLERNKKATFGKSSSSTKTQQYVSEHTFINSHQAILFRKFLLSRNSSDTYLHYLKIKAMSDHSPLGLKFPKADIEFWYEVQKYKGMFHAHTMESILDNKATAIIDCFFNSTVPPQLQVDVPLPQAEQVARKPCGPYLFRETQAVVFKLLYNGWKEYKNFTHSLDDKRMQKALDRLERDSLEGVRKKREQEEKGRQDEERRRLMLPHFETMEERELRIRREKEQEEFGPTAVEFRLSIPDTTNYVYYTDLPRSHSVSSLQITRMTFDEDELAQRQTQQEAVQKSKSDAQINEDIAESPKSSKSRPKKKLSKGSKSAKLQLKRGKKHFAIVDEVPIVEMLSEHKKDEVQRVITRVQTENWYSPGKSSQEDKSSVERLKPGRISSPMLNRTMSTLSSKISEARIGTGAQKRRPIRERVSEASVQGNVNTVKVHVSGVGSPYICGSGLPDDQSYLNITSREFYNNGRTS